MNKPNTITRTLTLSQNYGKLWMLDDPTTRSSRPTSTKRWGTTC